MRRKTIIACGLCCLVGAGFILWISFKPAASLTALREALEADRRDELDRLVTAIASDPSAGSEARQLAVEGALRLGRNEQAIELLELLAESETSLEVASRLRAAELRIQQGRLYDAVGLLQAILERSPDHPVAIRRLADVLDLQGRRRESARIRRRLLGLRQFSAEDLILLGNVEEPFRNDELIRSWNNSRQTDGSWRLVEALVQLKSGRTAAAVDLLRRILEEDPLNAEAHARLGMALLDDGRIQELAPWIRSLPAEAVRHPDVLFVRGELLALDGDISGATRCYLETLRAAPHHLPARGRLAQILSSSGHGDCGEVLLDQNRRLGELNSLLKEVYLEGPAPRRVARIIALARELDRFQEALAWTELSLTRTPEDVELRRTRDDLRRSLSKTPEWTIPCADLLEELASKELPAWPMDHLAAPTGAPGDGLPRVVFRDRANELGVQFVYDSGRDAVPVRIFLTMGGGVAALDYDVDGWPDLHFTQGAPWPPEEHQGARFDQLFRNVGGQARNTTELAHLREDRYSQGVAAGDYNGDGFPDLYVANVGLNRLFVNNGDGTFSDWSADVGLSGDQWTTSCVLADLNDDGVADIYDVNYIERGDAFTALCGDEVPRTCLPTMFHGEADRLFYGEGDGAISEAALDAVPAARGLGVVAAPLSTGSAISLFVANDMEANFLLRREIVTESEEGGLFETGQVAGVAMDRDGQAQACMGVAADDFDADGELDLFVTNFYNESNTLYRNESGGFFSDETRRFGLRTPSLQMLGFGTQAVDVDLDGLPDLVVTNGHIDDFRDRSIPYRMRPQLFRNRQGEEFVEDSDNAGPFFRRERLGRALVRIDWNRDGLSDFAVSHLDSPASLVLNASTDAGRSLVVRLVGTVSHRDAVGARVQLRFGQQAHVRTLTAGDGYQCSNERTLVFGMGSETHAGELVVDWPSGKRQSFDTLAAGRSYVIVEGRDSPVVISDHEARPGEPARREQ